MELKRAIEIIRTICKESIVCKDCPLFRAEKRRMCAVEDLCLDEIPIVEQKLIQWEKDHKKHYPTWRQWVRRQYPLGNDSAICPRKFYAGAVSAEECESMTCVECFDHSEISESVAKILGVKPIEGE